MGGVQYYKIFGQSIGSHNLAMATLGATGLIAWGSLRGGGKKQQKPQITASSKEEEDFLQEFIKSANEEEQKSQQKH